MFNDFLKKIFGSLKLYWQHVCLTILVVTWWITVKPKTLETWERLAWFVILIALGYSVARLVETKVGNGKGNSNGTQT
jgi:purine-cytosine permease-like protein